MVVKAKDGKVDAVKASVDKVLEDRIGEAFYPDEKDVAEKAKVEVKVEYVNPYEDIIKELDQIDLYQLTPMQAMNVMYELKVKMNQRK